MLNVVAALQFSSCRACVSPYTAVGGFLRGLGGRERACSDHFGLFFLGSLREQHTPCVWSRQKSLVAYHTHARERPEEDNVEGETEAKRYSYTREEDEATRVLCYSMWYVFFGRIAKVTTCVHPRERKYVIAFFI